MGETLNEVITVWRDGTWRVWSALDGQYACDAEPDDVLVNISLLAVLEDVEAASVACEIAAGRLHAGGPR